MLQEQRLAGAKPRAQMTVEETRLAMVAGRKWQIVRSYPGPRLMTVNGDEGEPGTFKDRYYLARNPHQMLEGALIAAWAVEAERVYIYMRDEYPAVLHILAHEIAALEQAGIVKDGDIELRRGAGA